MLCYNAFVPGTSTLLETNDKDNNKPKFQSVLCEFLDVFIGKGEVKAL